MGSRDPVGEIKARQRSGRHRDRHQQVHDGDDQGRRRDEPDDGEEDVPSPALLGLHDVDERDGHGDRGQDQHRGEVQEEAERTRHPGEADHERHLAVHGLFEGRPALVDEVVADVSRPVVDARLTLRRPGEMDRGVRHFQLALGTAAGDGLDGVAIAVAGEEILVGVDPRRIEAQHGFHQAQVLHEPSPVESRDEAQAADAVGYGDLVGRRAATSGFQQLDGAQALVGELMLEPGLDQRERRALSLKPGVEVLDERSRQGHRCVREVGEHVNKASGLFPGRGQDAIRPGDRHVALLAAARDARSHAADILEQSQAQHDGEGPQLPEVERIDGLIGGEERCGVVPVHPAVLMGDQVQGELVDAGETCRRAAHQPGQLPAVTPGQVPAGQGDLLLDEIVVVQQPRFRGHDPLARGGGRGDHLVGLEKDPLVLVQPGQQPVFSGPPVDAMRARQRDGMVLQLIAAEEFRAQQSHVGVVAQRVWLLSGGSRLSKDYGPAPLLKRQGALLDSVRLRGTSPPERTVELSTRRGDAYGFEVPGWAAA